MKNSFRIIGVVAFFIAFLLPQDNYGQVKLNIGDTYEEGIVFKVGSPWWGWSSIICQPKDLGKMDWNEAVAACKKLGNGWRLPTKDELNLMYKRLHKKSRGGFVDELYWSGQDEHDWRGGESDSFNVWDQNFYSGDKNFGGKVGFKEYVRAVKTVGEGDARKFEGGIIFSMDNSGQNFLKCQTKDLGKMDWNKAVAACKKLDDGWRLPTKDELNSMYENLHIKSRGGFVDDLYWSGQDQGDKSDVWDQNFNTGNPNFGAKEGYKEYVRAVKKILPPKIDIVDSQVEAPSKPISALKINAKPKIKISDSHLEAQSAPISGFEKWGPKRFKIGEVHEDGVVFHVNKDGTSGLLCEKQNIGTKQFGWLKAVKACSTERVGWRLPTKDEAYLMYQNISKLEAVPGFTPFNRDWGYWTSTEYTWKGRVPSEKDINNSAWVQVFNEGTSYPTEKEFAEHYARAVRTFKN